MPKEIRCPSCGASVKLTPGEKSMSCPYCDSSIVIPDELSGPHPDRGETDSTATFPRGMTVTTVDPAAAGRSCRRVALVMGIMMVAVIGSLVFFLTQSSTVIESVVDQVTMHPGRIDPSGTGSQSGTELGFGGEGTGPGLFTDASCIGIDAEGHIFVGERETGRIQVFDGEGTYLTQWTFGTPDDRWLGSMAVSREGTVYIVTGSELFVYDGMTGDSLGMLDHPEGWGFDDVTTCPDGSVLASWYKNRDDIIRFDRQGSMDLLIREAISGQSGDSELSTQVAVDGLGNIFALGEFNGSIFKFSEEGRFQTRFGSDGDRPGQFTSPSCIAADNLGNLWVSDFGDLLVFDGTGLYMGTFDPGVYISDMVIGDGNILYGLTFEQCVVRVRLSQYLEDI
jgi:hypothetical protein